MLEKTLIFACSKTLKYTLKKASHFWIFERALLGLYQDHIFELKFHD
jgi:hypothetical protein